MDALSTAITAVIIATGSAPQAHIPGPAASGNSIDTQIHYLEATGRRLEYLTGSGGRQYYKEQFQIRCQQQFGNLAGRLCPKYP